MSEHARLCSFTARTERIELAITRCRAEPADAAYLRVFAVDYIGDDDDDE